MHAPHLELATLARACLEHLDAEEAIQRSLHESLSELHTALRSGDQDALRKSAARHVEISQSNDALARRREALRSTAAAALGLAPARVTLTEFARRLPPPWSADIASAQKKLRQIVDANRVLARRTAAVLACCQSFARQLLADVCGPNQAVDRYGPAGTITTDPALTGAVTGVL